MSVFIRHADSVSIKSQAVADFLFFETRLSTSAAISCLVVVGGRFPLFKARKRRGDTEVVLRVRGVGWGVVCGAIFALLKA